MDSFFIPPENVIEQLKCSLCDSFLSVSPVALISEDGNQYKCGRCSAIKTTINTRATIYEHLAKLMTFPCNYKDCGKKIPFVDIKDHEKVCEQRSVICPKANCYESIKVQKIAHHFKEKHSEVYHTNMFCIKNVYAYYNIDVLEKNGKTYISIFDFDDNNFGLSICSTDPADNCQYEIKLKSDKSNFSISITNQNIILFNEREHCFKCVSGNCKSKFHVYKDNRKEISKRMTTKINRDSVKRMFGPGLITYTINIVEEGEKSKDKDDSKVEVKDAIIRKAKKILLQLLECPFCKEYMSPPIYQCLTGHTMCNTCKSSLSKCSTCDADIEKTRNYTLEELSKKVELPQGDDKKPRSKVV
ncbi:uncharacterized protein [Leptinotarsa decemlineata]|uniref:uncharacterized protein n=1 Tax=Leptinotarsa decemlineata TaxID=7539 RepID=UPI003D30B414